MQGFHHDKHGEKFDVEGTLAEAKASDHDAVLLPGGVINGDAIRTDKDAASLVNATNDAASPSLSFATAAGC